MLRSCVLVGVGAWLLGALVAHIVRVAQHEFLREAYLLIPVNLTSFYFLPLFAAGVFFLAKRQNRLSRAVRLAVLLALAFTAARVIYWWTVARDLIQNPGLGRFETAASAQSVTSALVGALGLASYVALAVGLWRLAVRSGGASRPNRPLQPTSGAEERR